MKTTLLIPVLNEISGLRVIMPKIERSWVDQILFVDGGSTDGTREFLQEEGYEWVQQEKKGLRNGYFSVLEKIRGEVVITFSPDGNCLPELIPALVEKMKGDYDMVIVSRYLNEATSQDDDFITAFGNWFFTKTVNLLFKASYTDVMGIFRAFKKDVIYRLNLDQEKSYHFFEKCFFTNISWEPLLSVRAARYGLKLAEIPGDEPRRFGGERKLQILRWGAAYYSQFLVEFLKGRP